MHWVVGTNWSVSAEAVRAVEGGGSNWLGWSKWRGMPGKGLACHLRGGGAERLVSRGVESWLGSSDRGDRGACRGVGQYWSGMIREVVGTWSGLRLASRTVGLGGGGKERRMGRMRRGAVCRVDSTSLGRVSRGVWFEPGSRRGWGMRGGGWVRRAGRYWAGTIRYVGLVRLDPAGCVG